MLLALRNVLLILSLAAASSSAMADWVKLGNSQTDTLYVDPSTIRATDDRARMWALNDFGATQRLDEREPFQSEKAEYEYDCKWKQSRLLYFTSHSGHMAEGELVDFNIVPGEWTRIPAGSGLEVM
jgi:hypothetical protein